MNCCSIINNTSTIVVFFLAFTALVRDILTTELGSITALFREFDDEPVAAASVGQVHRAILHDGRDVAVKIQYPSVAQAISDGLANTELLVTFLKFMTAASGIPLDLRALAREAAARIAEEVDYQHEAHMISLFSDLYRGHPPSSASRKSSPTRPPAGF